MYYIHISYHTKYTTCIVSYHMIHHIFFTPQRNYFYTSIQESSGGIPLSDEDDSSDVVTSSVDGGITVTGNDLVALF